MEDKLKLLEKDLLAFKPILAQAAETVINEDVSKYPIFVVHQHQVDIGIPIVDIDEHKAKWSVHVSTLEEFVTKQIISLEKLDEFRATYKKATDKYCLFVLSELGATFIFLTK
jgi:hypothetical protein